MKFSIQNQLIWILIYPEMFDKIRLFSYKSVRHSGQFLWEMFKKLVYFTSTIGSGEISLLAIPTVFESASCQKNFRLKGECNASEVVSWCAPEISGKNHG